MTLNASANEQWDRWRSEKEACLFCGLRESHSTHTASSLAPQGVVFLALKVSHIFSYEGTSDIICTMEF